MAAKRKHHKVSAAKKVKRSELAKFIADLRTAYGMNQRQFADKLGYSPAYIGQLEADYHDKPDDFIKKLWPTLRLDEREKLLAILIGITKRELDSTLKG